MLHGAHTIVKDVFDPSFHQKQLGLNDGDPQSERLILVALNGLFVNFSTRYHGILFSPLVKFQFELRVFFVDVSAVFSEHAGRFMPSKMMSGP